MPIKSPENSFFIASPFFSSNFFFYFFCHSVTYFFCIYVVLFFIQFLMKWLIDRRYHVLDHKRGRKVTLNVINVFIVLVLVGHISANIFRTFSHKFSLDIFSLFVVCLFLWVLSKKNEWVSMLKFSFSSGQANSPKASVQFFL